MTGNDVACPPIVHVPLFLISGMFADLSRALVPAAHASRIVDHVCCPGRPPSSGQFRDHLVSDWYGDENVTQSRQWNEREDVLGQWRRGTLSSGKEMKGEHQFCL